MSTTTINNHDYFTLEGFGDFLKVNSDRIDYFIDLINSSSLKNIGVNFNWGYTTNEIRFLMKCPGIEKIYIVGDNFDLEPLNYLKKLTFISTSSKIGNLDFSNFSNLSYCCITWGKGPVNLEKCRNLNDLKIYKLKLGYDLSGLPSFPKLAKLELNGASIESLAGIERYSLLDKFSGYYLSKLVEISAIALLPNLTTVILESCKRINKFDDLERNKNLQKIILTNCGKIQSIKFIRHIVRLNFFTFIGSDVEDGDMTPCIGLNYFAFSNRKYYSHTTEEIRAITKDGQMPPKAH